MKVAPPGSGDPLSRSPHAGELFTDREIEARAFKAALAHFRRLLDSDDDPGPARRNVLTFYGLGGIGKTALSERLEAWVDRRLPLENGWGPPPATPVAATARVDLHGSAGRVDAIAVLLALRSGMSRVHRRWPAFDLAFTTYWSAIRPGEPLPVFRGESDLTDAIVESVVGVCSEVGSLSAVFGAPTAAGSAVRGARMLIGHLRRHRDLKLSVAAFPGFERFLLRCADEPSRGDPRADLVSDIAGVLAWELSTTTPHPLAAVFVDATERFALDPRREAEDLLSTVVYRMPNVFFVLTGRDMLTWFEQRRVELTHRGPWTWPDLLPSATGEPRQHLVGNLSVNDRREAILRARRRDNLAMSDDVVEELVVASAGLPLYLESARQAAISIRSSGRHQQVTITDVTGSLGSLVNRVLDDIPADEQRAIRAACLFRVFDCDLVAAAAAVDHGCAERALGRPIIDCIDGERFPFRMHDAVRESIRGADHLVAGGWSARDWQIASARAASAARQLHDRAKALGDTRATLDAIAIAITLACDQETDLERNADSAYGDWLTRAIVYSPSVQGLAARVPAVSATEYGRHVLEFISGKSLNTPLEERLQSLRRVLDADHPLRLPAGRHLGYTLRGRCRWEEALAVFDEVIGISPAPVNVRQRPITLSSARRFHDASREADGTDAVRVVRRMAEYAHGDPNRYFSEVPGKIAILRKAGRQREELEELGDLLVRRAFFKGDVRGGEIAAFIEQAETAGHMTAVRCGLQADVLARGRDSAASLDRLRGVEMASLGRISFRSAFGEICDALVLRQEERLMHLRDQVPESARSRSWIPVECFLASFGLAVPPVPTQWLESPKVVEARWSTHLRDYLARVQSNMA